MRGYGSSLEYWTTNDLITHYLPQSRAVDNARLARVRYTPFHVSLRNIYKGSSVWNDERERSSDIMHEANALKVRRL